MDNKTRTITSFISSKNRQSQENVYDFTIDYPDNILLCRQNEYMELNILSFDMANTMYNINGNNNSFELITNGTALSLNIPSGNYNIKTFGNKIQSLINNPNITIVYNEAQNTYTFTKLSTDTNIYKIKPITIGKLIGLNDNQEYTLNFDTGLIDLIDYNKVVIHTNNLSFYYSNVANKQNNQSIFNNVIFWKSKADIEPYALMRYNNEDGGNSFVYKIQDKQIPSINFMLKNERGEFIEDAPDYLMVVQYNFYEMKDTTTSLISIDKQIKEIYNLLIFALQRLKLLL